MTQDWTEYGELYIAEKIAYAAYRDEAEGSDRGRIRPTKLREAQRAWYDALTERYALEGIIALQLGIHRYEVPIRYLEATTYPTKKVRR